MDISIGVSQTNRKGKPLSEGHVSIAKSRMDLILSRTRTREEDVARGREDSMCRKKKTTQSLHLWTRVNNRGYIFIYAFHRAMSHFGFTGIV